MREAAITLGARFRVLPLWPILPALHGNGHICGCGKLQCGTPGKHPLGRLVPNGSRAGTQDARVIDHWWKCRPDANIGIATGNGLVVLDVDPRHGGDASIAELQKKYGRLPQTLTCRTGGGGWHAYFAGDAPNSVGTIGQGLDVRGAGGLVVAPPSLHVSGNRYQWRGSPNEALASLPGWVTELLASSQPSRNGRDWSAVAHADVPSGKRNTMVTSVAGHVLRYLDPHLAYDLTWCWNQVHCKPPLEEEEFNKILGSIASRELRRRGAA